MPLKKKMLCFEDALTVFMPFFRLKLRGKLRLAYKSLCLVWTELLVLITSSNRHDNSYTFDIL